MTGRKHFSSFGDGKFGYTVVPGVIHIGRKGWESGGRSKDDA